MRTFISIDLPKEVKEEIKKIQDRLPDFIGKKTELDNLHLTLKFFGEIDKREVDEVKEKLREIKFKSFETEIDSIGVFSEKFIRIVWLHLKNCDGLQREVDNKLKDLLSEERRFMSHLTIARVKAIKERGEFLKKLKEIKISPIKFKVNNYKLKKSTLTPDGPIYETIEEYSLD